MFSRATFLTLCVLCPWLIAAADVDDKKASASCISERHFCAAVAGYARLLRLPGYALAVAKEGQIIYLQTDGYADLEQRRPIRVDSIFPVASITKTFTAALMMQYAEAGRIRLDDYLTDYPQIDDVAAWLYSSPDIRIRHVLSHTSQGAIPGDVFSYNGNRFNYVYGVFVKMSGETDYARAFAGEVKKGILGRLGLKDTLTEFPDAAGDAHTTRIVTPYRYDATRATFVADGDLRTAHKHAYPNSGMLSTLADLARYADALDRTALMSKASVATMTAPFRLNDGADSPYGLGWFSEELGGLSLNWVYGLGPSYASVLIHVPGARLSLIFLANNDGPTASLRLNYGNVLQFPLAAPFLRRFAAAAKAIPTVELDSNLDGLEARLASMPAKERSVAFAQVIGIASTWRYAESVYSSTSGKALRLVLMLRRIDPAYFRTLHPELIGLIRDIADGALIEPMNDLAAAYDASGTVDPRISQDLSNFYDRLGLDAAANRYRTALVLAPGYEQDDATIASAFELGDQYFRNGDIAMGRKYYWLGIRDAAAAGWSAGFAEQRRQRMNALTIAIP
jgi:CubicO group peptidase (beta-lactamase class C family)